MQNAPTNTALRIIAGPCSVDYENVRDIYRIADIEVHDRNTAKKHRAIWGARVVGLKSRTVPDLRSGAGLGIDYPAFKKNLDALMRGGSLADLETAPSCTIAKKLIADTGMVVATEIMEPLVQLPVFEKQIPRGKLFIWNPAVNQLGWPILAMGAYAKRNGWYLGLKNGKWMGSPEPDGTLPIERTWLGLTKYSDYNDGSEGMVVLIHRGVEAEQKGEYRNLPVHDAAKRVKAASGSKLFFDPSHSLGPKLRDRIVEETASALAQRTESGEYLYDGLLIEAGRSESDTAQHITIEELDDLCQRLSEFRELLHVS